MLLDSTKYLHIQVSKCLYQFNSPTREDVLRNLRARVPPPLTGAIPPGAVRLFNTISELDQLYALVAKESEEHDLPNTKLGQRLVAWLNRYLVDLSCTPLEAKPQKNNIIIHVLSKWRPPAWVMSCGKNKREGYKKAYQAAQESTHVQCKVPPLPLSSVTEAQQPPATLSLSSVLEVLQPPSASSSAPVMTHPRTFGVMTTSRRILPPPTMPPLILTQKSCTTYLRQDGFPRGGPSWGDELAKWRDFILHLCHCGQASRFLRI